MIDNGSPPLGLEYGVGVGAPVESRPAQAIYGLPQPENGLLEPGCLSATPVSLLLSQSLQGGGQVHSLSGRQ